MHWRRIAVLALIFVTVLGAKKKKPEDETETLAVPPDPPMVATGQTSRLVFNSSPLSNKGLLSQQTRDALKTILKATGNAPIIHIRAFVAGSGDLRRVPQIVSEVLTEKHMALPSVSVVQVGALPMEGAQVVMEAISEGRKDVNPDGLTFGVGPTPEQALHGATPLMATCFMNSLESKPGANVVQMRRESGNSATICEAVGRGGEVKDAKLIFTGTQVAFGNDDKASALAIQRLERDLAGAREIASNVYVVTRRPASPTPNATVIPVEGVAASEGSFAMDAIAVGK